MGMIDNQYDIILLQDIINHTEFKFPKENQQIRSIDNF